MVFEHLPNCNDYELNNKPTAILPWLDIAETKPSADATALQSLALTGLVTWAGLVLALLKQSNTPHSFSFILCALSKCLVMLLTPNFHWIHVCCVMVLLCRPATPTGCVLSPPRRSTVDSWRSRDNHIITLDSQLQVCVIKTTTGSVPDQRISRRTCVSFFEICVLVSTQSVIFWKVARGYIVISVRDFLPARSCVSVPEYL